MISKLTDAEHLRIYTSYRDDPANKRCEIAWYLGITWIEGRYVPLGTKTELNPEPGCHHLFSCGTRPHLRSNLIRVCPEVHRLVHRGIRLEPQTIRLACILAKCVKRDEMGDPAEFDVEEMRATNPKGALGWVLVQEFSEPWQVRMQSEAVSRLTALAKERE